MIIDTNAGVYEIPAGTLDPTDMETGLLHAVGVYPDLSYITQTIKAVVPNSAADEAGLRAGDVVVAIGEYIPKDWSETHAVIESNPNTMMEFVLWRDEEALSLTVELEERVTDKGEFVGYLGVLPEMDRSILEGMLITVNYGFFEAAGKGIKQTVGDASRTLHFLVFIFSGRLSFGKNVSGPVGIAQGAGTAATGGFMTWWKFVALISVSLAVVNLLPFPILDGGRMLICIVQGLIRRRLSAGVAGLLDKIGVMLILLLLVSAVGSDLMKLG